MQKRYEMLLAGILSETSESTIPVSSNPVKKSEGYRFAFVRSDNLYTSKY